MPFAQASDGSRIHYRMDGPADAPVVVLSNSLGADLGLWEPLLPVLPGVQVLRYDTRGHGASDAPAGPYTIERLGLDVVELLDALHIERASFCGISMGGGTGQWLGLNAPGRLHRLVLANTAAQFGAADVWNDRIAMVEREGVEPLVAPTLERWFTPEFRAEEPEIVTQIGETLSATSPIGYAACCAAIRDIDFRTQLSSITAPTLVVGGRRDPSTPPEKAQEIAAGIAGAQLVMLESAHLSCVEQARPFGDALRTFIG